MASTVESTAAVADPDRGGGRVLVFIVAYRAEKHLQRVFEQVPAELFSSRRVHFLVIDDASDDAGASVATEWLHQRGIGNVTVLRNPVNQGYGGNQKLGYRIAIDGGFDFVILLHGDGQYDPAMLSTFIQTWDRTGADVILGSRMTDLRSARRGGMPWYKLIGNRILTGYQNRLTGRKISEYHTGYRGYSTAMLRKVPFEIDTNDFHFDTEILLQAMHVGARFEEFAIPTRYGDEVCNVNGMKYARDVFFSTLVYKLHQHGMLCDLKYRDISPAPPPSPARPIYTAQALALEAIERHRPRTVLDIGAAGGVARRCGELGIGITGIDSRRRGDEPFDAFHECEIDRGELSVDPFAYDLVLLIDQLEHLFEPEQFLVRMRNRTRALGEGRSPPLVVIASPNVGFITVRLNLLLGRFPYSERGILNIRHRRLFTRSSLLRMLRDCGYRVERVRAAGAPFEAVLGGKTGRLLGWISRQLARAYPRLFAFQFVVHCRPKPGVPQLIAQSQQFLVEDDVLAQALFSPQRTVSSAEV